MLLTNEKARKGLGWAIAAILSPIIVAAALLCVLGSGAVSHNISAAQLCFQDGPLPGGLPAGYQACIGQTRASFAELDEILADIQSNMEDGNSLDPIRVKAVFFSLYFGGEAPPLSQFAHCFASSEIRTRSVTEQDGDGNDIQVEQTYSVFVPIEDMKLIQLLRQTLLFVWVQMRIGVQCGFDILVSQAFCNLLGRNSHLNQKAGMAVTK